ncbi:hypothetical protein BCR34DRAFT_608240 [Clohesyomyces aquaticus]|uniref:Uncharacterized protein n=1 Tax=Clohesyomyces aquaticus TaxID=1231657 RepID=A0A1Y1Y952_9PLEO|nr:hypothetical protein BCR34DRAFT_608240 [Clohesyomyces aquaticus]
MTRQPVILLGISTSCVSRRISSFVSATDESKVGKDTVNLGVRIIDDIHHHLAEVCHEHGQYDSSDVTFSTAAWALHNYEPGTITITPNGAYQTWTRNGLLDTLMAAVRAIAVCEKGTYKGPPCNRQISEWAMHTRAYTIYSVQGTQLAIVALTGGASGWGINYQGPSEGCPGCAPSFMEFGVSMETVDEKLCENLLGAAGGVSTIAGAVIGETGAVVGSVLSGIFALGALFCEQH